MSHRVTIALLVSLLPCASARGASPSSVALLEPEGTHCLFSRWTVGAAKVLVATLPRPCGRGEVAWSADQRQALVQLAAAPADAAFFLVRLEGGHVEPLGAVEGQPVRIGFDAEGRPLVVANADVELKPGQASLSYDGQTVPWSGGDRLEGARPLLQFAHRWEKGRWSRLELRLTQENPYGPLVEVEAARALLPANGAVLAPQEAEAPAARAQLARCWPKSEVQEGHTRWATAPLPGGSLWVWQSRGDLNHSMDFVAFETAGKVTPVPATGADEQVELSVDDGVLLVAHEYDHRAPRVYALANHALLLSAPQATGLPWPRPRRPEPEAFVDGASHEGLRFSGSTVSYRAAPGKAWQPLTVESNTGSSWAVRFPHAAGQYLLTRLAGSVSCRNPDGTAQTFLPTP